MILDEIWRLEIQNGVCINNDVLGVNSHDVINGRKHYIADVHALWSQNETLTSGGCFWWYSPEDVSETDIQTRNVFSCLKRLEWMHILRSIAKIKIKKIKIFCNWLLIELSYWLKPGFCQKNLEIYSS